MRRPLHVLIVVPRHLESFIEATLRHKVAGVVISRAHTLEEAERVCEEMPLPCHLAIIDSRSSAMMLNYRFGDGRRLGCAEPTRSDNGCKVYLAPTDERSSCSWWDEPGFDLTARQAMFELKRVAFEEKPDEFASYVLASYERHIKMLERGRACKYMLSQMLPHELVACGYANCHVAFRRSWDPRALPHAATLNELNALFDKDELHAKDGPPVFFALNKGGYLR